MRTAVDIAADLAEQYGGPDFDVLGFAADFLRAQPRLVLHDAEEFESLDDGPIERQRIKRRNAALTAVVVELELLGMAATAPSISNEWLRYLGSATARRWRELGGPDRDANELDARLYLLTLHNRGAALSVRQLRAWLAARPLEARASCAATLPSATSRSPAVASPRAAE